MLLAVPPPSGQPGIRVDHGSDADLRKAAKQLEATFLSEMLKYAGPREDEEGFTSQSSEFDALMRFEQAKMMTERGGIGLAEALFESLKERRDGR